MTESNLQNPPLPAPWHLRHACSIGVVGNVGTSRRYFPITVSSIVTHATDSLAEKEGRPTIKERLTKDTIKETLLSIEGGYYSITDNDG